MLKKNYEGLDVAFVPVTGADIIKASTTTTCKVISVQYYVGQENWGECTTDQGDGDGEGYSYNWNMVPIDE